MTTNGLNWWKALQKKRLFFLSAVLLFALQATAAWDKLFLIENGKDLFYNIPSSGVKEILVSALSDETNFSGSYELFAPTGGILRVYGGVDKGSLTVIYGNGYYETFEAGEDFTNIWSKNGYMEFRATGEEGVGCTVTVQVLNPNNITAEDELRSFMAYYEYGDTLHLKLGANITLQDMCSVPYIIDETDHSPKSINAELDLNGYTITRGRSAVSDRGHVFIVGPGGVLTIVDNGGGPSVGSDAGTITGGWATEGGGIYVAAGGTLYVNGGAITGCKASEKGGAIYNAGTTVVNGGSIRLNKGKDCGGIHNASSGTLTLNGGNIFSNESEQGGGGVVNYGTATMNDAWIVGNTAATRGGGIWNGGTMTINGGTIQSNTANINGGGIYNKAKLTITGISTDGLSITDNSAPDGGGIYNDAGSGSTPSVLNISGGSITANETTQYGGGGITNYGTLVMSNGTIEGNTSVGRGSGIFVGGDAGTITMFGTPVIRNNTSQNTSGVNDLFLCNGKKLKLSSPLEEGAYISVSTEYGYSMPITENYVEKHPTARPDAYIHYSTDDCGLIIYDNEVARLPYVTVQYYPGGSYVTTVKCMDLSKLLAYLDGNPVEHPSFGLGKNDAEGWFVATTEYYITRRVWAKGKVNLILLDDKKLTIEGGLAVNEDDGSSLDIWPEAKTTNKGSLVVYGSGGAAIGGDNGHHSGPITIHGGNITATAGGSGAAIGGGMGACNGPIHIIRGHIVASSTQEAGAAIGCGSWSGDNVSSLLVYDPTNTSQAIDVDPHVYNASITIDDGYIEAKGPWGGAGIGGGWKGYFLSTITINGGEVHATGGLGAAGIGAGREGSCYLFRYPQAEPRERQATIIINGGKVYATAGAYAAAIGGGQQMVNNPDLSDIGSYEGAALPTYQGGGANVIINGGYVKAMPTELTQLGGAEAIGHGGAESTFSNKPVSGGATLFGKARVIMFTTDYPALASERVEALRGIATIIETCDHRYNEIGTHEIVDSENHSNCRYCLTPSEQEPHQFGDYGLCSGCGLIALMDNPVEKANQDAIAHWEQEGNKHDVVLLGRKLYGNGLWNTLCLPFDLSKTETTATLAPSAVMTIKGENGSAFADGTLTLNFSDTEETEDTPYIKAGTPYIVKWEKEEGTEVKWTSPIFRDVKLKTERNNYEDDNIIFKGTFNPINYTTNDGPQTSILFLKSQKVYDSGVETEQSTLFYPDGEAPTTIGPFRAYFELKEPLHAGELELPEFVRSFNLNFGGEEQTGIIDAPRIADRRERATDNAVYDLQGRRVGRAEANSSLFTLRSSLKKGLYINGHRKVVVK